jgi:hypothetical protein
LDYNSINHPLFDFFNVLKVSHYNMFVRGPMYHVNAVKAVDGRWRQHPNGQEVLFHHYLEFDKESGQTGDTLVWDSHIDRLIIQHNNKRKYHALCYREKDRK